MNDRLRSAIARAIPVTASPRFSQALTEVILVASLSMHALRSFLGWPGALAVLAGLVVLAAVSLAGQPERIEWRGALPISLLALLGFMAISVLWSQYTWASLGGVAYTFAFAALGFYVALARDTIQIVRAVGNSLRVILVGSLAIEVLSGIIIDTPLRFLGIAGNLAEGGPIQGLAGTRNYLAFLGALAILTFWIEYRTRTVSPRAAGLSLAAAAAAIALARSPVSWLVLAAVGLAGLVLLALRRLEPHLRAAIQGFLAVSTFVFALIAWFFRAQLIQLADATGDVLVRTSVWTDLESYIGQYVTLGWGWVGPWPKALYPFSVVRDATGNSPNSALNAYVDITLQLGVVGLGLLLVALGLAIARTWLVASERRSTVHVWPALTLLLLATVSMTESFILLEGGLAIWVVTAVTAARSRPGRRRA